jgi:hypothetical protein
MCIQESIVIVIWIKICSKVFVMETVVQNPIVYAAL